SARQAPAPAPGDSGPSAVLRRHPRCAGRALARHPRGLLRRRRRAARERDHGLSRPSVRPPARDRAFQPRDVVGRPPRARAAPPPPQGVHRPQAPQARRRGGPRQRGRTGPHSVTARNRELLALVPASALLTAGFAAIFVQRSDVLSNVSLTYGLIFLGLCFAAHLVIRFTLPHADPYMFPLVAVLACFGLVVVYRINEDLARDQAQWFVIGLILFAVTIVALRDFRVMERYRYTIAFAGLALLLLPRVPGIGQQVNGAYLGVKLGPITFQPAEFGKIAIVIFLAAYLRDTREVMIQSSRRFLGVTIPSL